MKTPILLLSMALIPAAWSHAQAPAGAQVVYDAQLGTVNTNLTSIDDKLKTISEDVAQQLEIAKEDTQSMEDIKKGVQDTVERLDSLLERIGNPADVNMDKAGDLRDHVSNALSDGLKERPEVKPPGKDIFDETGDGIIKPLGSSYEYRPSGGGDARNENRDVTRYVGESEQLKAVEEYYRVRDAAVERRTELLKILNDVLEDMQNNSDDFAHIAKQTALVDVIQGQLQVCSNDINNAFNDVAVKGVHVYALNSLRSKGDAEPAMLEAKEQQDALDTIMSQIDSGATAIPAKPSSSATIQTGFLPWPVRQ